MIQKLPQYLINQLKAGEIVERPASIVKELVENSLDAGATDISVEIGGGGKKLIKIQDNGNGMSKEDLEMSIQRYATSKITTDSDLQMIQSYGFRGEALASVSEVSIFRMQTKQSSDNQSDGRDGSVTHPLGEAQSDEHIDLPEIIKPAIGYELYRSEHRYIIKEIPFARAHGTTVFVEDIFHHIPAREKFLKSDATERRYIKTLFLQYALVQRDKKRTLIKDGKQIFMLQACDSLLERLLQITKKDREKNLKPIAYKDEQLELYGVAGDASLHFSSGQYFWIFVNGRPVQDRVVKKAIMEAYKRQIVPGSYPFVCLFIEIDPKLVDVNVHPRKSEVKFLDPGSMFTRVKESISQLIGDQKVNYAAFKQADIQQDRTLTPNPSPKGRGELTLTQVESLKQVGEMRKDTGMFGAGDVGKITLTPALSPGERENVQFVAGDESYILVGQLRQSYILLESPDALVYIDQHALAERIAFEQMKKKIAAEGFVSEVLLQPLSLEAPKDIDLDKKIQQLQSVGFDVSLLSESKIVVYAIPQVFHTWKVSIELVVNWVWGSPSMETLTPTLSQGERGHELFTLMLDEMVGMKACKASIKAGQKLSMQEMKQLVEDGFTYITGMFVCQHGRPSAVRIEKGNVDGLFER